MAVKKCVYCGASIRQNTESVFKNPYYKTQYFCSTQCKRNWIYALQKGEIDKRTIVKKIGRPKKKRVKENHKVQKESKNDMPLVKEKEIIQKFGGYSRVEQKAQKLKTIIKNLNEIQTDYKDVLRAGDDKIIAGAESLIKQIIYKGN